METIFVTGGTGYLGGYVLLRLLEDTDSKLAILVRAKGDSDATEKLWRGLQLHLDEATFRRYLPRFSFIRGDLTGTALGLSPADRADVISRCGSILHIAASLNRRSEKACLNANLRGTLAMIKLAREIQNANGLRRFSHVSTVAVAGQRDREVIQEDTAIEWDRSDYDPYGRTKKFAEHMVRELLPDVEKTFFRPSIVMGDSQKPETTQFDMVKAFCLLADFPILPMRAEARLDIVNADWVGRAIATLHSRKAKHEIYHLASGTDSPTALETARAVLRGSGRRVPRFVPTIEKGFATLVDQALRLPKGPVSGMAGLLKVFLPYITYDTVFDNQRAVQELGVAPTSFVHHAADVYRWSKQVNFQYPYRALSPTAG